MPNFHDLPDGSSSINHTGEDFWIEDDHMSETSFTAELAPPYPEGVTRWPAPHPSYADGSAPLTPPPINGFHNTAIGASAMAYNTAGTHTARRSAAPRTAAEALREATERFTTTIDTSPQVCDPSPPRRSRRRRETSDPDAAIRKDPNAWSLREAVELCKLLEVVLPEAGFHIALTGGLLYKEGRRKDCDLMFYQIRQMEPNYDILWKYLTVAGVIRSPSYPENGWLVKATYRGKAIDCLFPNAKKVKKAGAANPDCYKSAPAPAPIVYRPGTLVRHIDGVPEFSADLERRTGIVDPTAEGQRRMAVCEDCAVPGDFENPAPIPEPPF